MPNTVTYRGHRDRNDATTEVQVEVDGDTYTFADGQPVADVPDTVVARLEGPDLKGHRFDVASADAPAEPFAGYDGLSVDDVVERLAGLSDDEVDAVKAYEAEHKDRKTITGYERA